MKKKLAVAMAITASVCFAGSGQVKPALAGYWIVLPNPCLDQYGVPPAPSDPAYPHYQTEQGLRAQGNSSYSFTDGYWGPQSYSMNWQDDDPYLSGSGFDANTVLLISSKRGTTGSVTASGKRRIRFQWIRNKINGINDPNDNPPATLNLRRSL